MSTKLKIGLIILAVAILAFVVYYFKFKGTAVAPGGTFANPDVKPMPTDNDSFPLTMGSRGKNVIYLQRALNYIKPANNLVEDGVLMDRTRAALLTTVATSLSSLPLTEDRFNKIIKMGNEAKGA